MGTFPRLTKNISQLAADKRDFYVTADRGKSKGIRGLPVTCTGRISLTILRETSYQATFMPTRPP